jgi:hypothetical protein
MLPVNQEPLSACEDAAQSDAIRFVAGAPRWAWLAGGTALLLSILLAAGRIATVSPWWDEGVFADVAVMFRNHGHLGSAVLASHGYNNMPAVDRYTYWQFPLYLISLGWWFRILPPTIEVMRAFSVLWNCAYVWCWFLFVRALSRNETLALAISSIISLDCVVIANASDGRMESMCAALGQAALAAYACLREKRPKLAASLAGLFGAASLFCHPMGVVMNAFLLALLIWDRKQWRWMQTKAFFAPYAIGGVLCLWYIEQAPAIFVAQFHAAAGYRMSGPVGVIERVFADSSNRYLAFYVTDQGRLKPLALLFGIAGVAGIVLNHRLRRERFSRLLLGFAAVGYLGVALVDNKDFWYYLNYSMTTFDACAGLWVYNSWKGRRWDRFVATALLAGFIGATLSNSIAVIRRDTFRRSYDPALAAVKRYLRPGGLVMGPSEFGFTLGWGKPLIDDCYLGYASGIVPDVYVMHNCCTPNPYSNASWKWSRAKLESRYTLVEAERTFWPYWIYVRNDLLTAATAPHPSEQP